MRGKTGGSNRNSEGLGERNKRAVSVIGKYRRKVARRDLVQARVQRWRRSPRWARPVVRCKLLAEKTVAALQGSKLEAARRLR